MCQVCVSESVPFNKWILMLISATKSRVDELGRPLRTIHLKASTLRLGQAAQKLCMVVDVTSAASPSLLRERERSAGRRLSPPFRGHRSPLDGREGYGIFAPI